MSPFWRPESWGSSKIFGKSVTPGLINNKLHGTCPVLNTDDGLICGWLTKATKNIGQDSPEMGKLSD
jgi:hypothetical protein